MTIKNKLTLALLLWLPITMVAQTLAPLDFDPSRHSNLGNIDKQSARTKAFFLDTLSLPFFEDFTQVSAPIDSVITESGLPLVVRTFGHHGLTNYEKIFFKLKSPNNRALEGNYFAVIRNKKEFLLSKSNTVPDLVISDGTTLLADWAQWQKPNSKIGPNPDTLKWYGEGGTLINNRTSIDPPSLFVASFDGLDANGSPYRTSSIGSNTDELTSQCFNLLGLEAKDSVTLSFYLEGGGLGLAPQLRDSIFLFFKDKDQRWIYVWGRKGSGGKIPYYQVQVKIKDSRFFHADFQFKFQRFNRNSGAVGGVFSIDYIYFDKNWNVSKTYTRDRAVSNTMSSILKNYSAMPYFQFSNEELHDQVKFSVQNLSKDTVGFGFNQKYLYPDGTESPLFNREVDFLYPSQTLYGSWPVNPELIKKMDVPFEVKYEVFANTNDIMSEERIRFKMNNADSGSTKFDNYYAYDDGTGELQLSIQNLSSGGRLMMKYTLQSLPDTITHIDMFTPLTWFTLGTDPRYKASRLVVANSDLNIIEESTTDVSLQFPKGRNVFARYALKKPFIPSTKDFYIGFEQPHGLEVAYGWDINKGAFTCKFYSFPAGPWQDLKLDGVPMIRPVFRINDPNVGLDETNKNILKSKIYPNPSTGVLNIESEASLIEIWSLQGELLMSQSLDSNMYFQSINIAQLNNGVYLVKLSNQSKQSIQKMALVR
jgi:hypothetical protein